MDGVGFLDFTFSLVILVDSIAIQQGNNFSK